MRVIQKKTYLIRLKAATILGTMQATLTNFKYLRRQWKDTTEKERLLGVSLTGIMDHKILSGDIYNKALLNTLLVKLKDKAVAVNKMWSKRFGINQATAITCVKPSGTVSQLVNLHLVYMQDTTIIIFVELEEIRKIH